MKQIQYYTTQALIERALMLFQRTSEIRVQENLSLTANSKNIQPSTYRAFTSLFQSVHLSMNPPGFYR